MPGHFRHAAARRTGGIMVMVLGLSGLLGVSACSKKPEAKAPEHAATVEAVRVTQSVQPTVVEGTGTISAWQEVPVGAETGGLTAVKLLGDEGMSVKAGDPLLQMDDILLKAQLRQAQAQADQAAKAYERSRTLFDKGYLSQAALDTAYASHETTAAALQTAQTQASLATVRAPVGGIIVSRKAVLGQIVQSGAELFRIVRDGRIELNMEVVENRLPLIHAGQTAMVTSEAGQDITGTVRIVTASVDPISRLGTARISVPWASGLRPGMFAHARIETDQALALSVPQKAIVYNQNKPSVFWVGPDQHVHRREVTLGQIVGDNVVVSGGVNLGDEVITTGAGFLVEGDKVKISNVTASVEGR